MCEIDGFQLVLDPTGEAAEPKPSPGAGRRAEGTLQGKRVGIIDNRLTGMSHLADALATRLVDAYDVEVVRRWMIPHSIVPDPAVLERIPGDVDLVVIGLGNCGACTTWECALSARLRDELLPTIDVVTEPFASLARAVFRGHGLSEQPLVILPQSAETAADDEVAEFAAAIAAACASELTTAGA